MNVLGLDLSLTSTGVAAPDGSAHRIRPEIRGMGRLLYIRESVILAVADVDVVMVEGYAYGAHHRAHNIGELGGVIRLALWENDIPYIDVAPPTLKMFATGKGNAKKDAVLAEAIRRLDYQGSSNDEADALWLRQLGLHLHDCGEVKLPDSHLRALDKLVAVSL